MPAGIGKLSVSRAALNSVGVRQSHMADPLRYCHMVRGLHIDDHNRGLRHDTFFHDELPAGTSEYNPDEGVLVECKGTISDLP